MMRFLVFLLCSVLAKNNNAATTVENIVCSTSADCPNSAFAKCDSGFCEHKDVFPATISELVGVFLLPILLGLANNGGVGGGGLIIPICIAVFGFSTIQAIALSNSTIFVGGAVRYFGFSLR